MYNGGAHPEEGNERLVHPDTYADLVLDSLVPLVGNHDVPDNCLAEAEEGAVATEEAARLRYPRIRPSREEAIAIQRAVSVRRVTNNAVSTVELVRRTQ